jgi:hypothetical protein
LKNQYFGDINDYRKYGLLRVLTNGGEIKTAVCWMLTPDDGLGDGGSIGYLERPEDWRDFDGPLFDRLQGLVQRLSVRDVRGLEACALLPSCRFAPGFVPDDAEGRDGYIEAFADLARGCDLIFFDPDNGIEVISKPYGRRGSSKYLYWHEIERFWNAGHSLLIYQHFPHVKRAPYVESKVHQLMEKTGAAEVVSFRTSHVVFFLLPQPERGDYFRGRSKLIADRWRDEIRVAYHSG